MLTSLLRLKRRTQLLEDEIQPEPQAKYTPPVARKIHPDLNALEAELDLQPRENVDALAGPRSLPVSPRLRPREDSIEDPTPVSPIQAAGTTLDDLPESSVSLTSASGSTSSHGAQPTGNRAQRLLTRLTAIGRPSTATSSNPPPSAWSTFGRTNASPNVADFGGFTPGSQSLSRTTSQRSHSVNTRSQTPSSIAHSPVTPVIDTTGGSAVASSPPSSGFTFGSHLNAFPPRAGTLPPSPPPLPPLDHPAFQLSPTASDSVKQPRHAASLPSMHHGESSNHRPRIHDIFPSTSSRHLASSVGSRRSPSVKSRRAHRRRSQEQTVTDYGSVFGSRSRAHNPSSLKASTQGLGSPISLHDPPDNSFTLSSTPTQDSLPDDSFNSIDMAPGNGHLFSGMGPSDPQPLPPSGGAALPSALVSTPAAVNTAPPRIEPSTPQATEKSKGKRKAEDLDRTPPDVRKEKGSQRATFAPEEPRPLRPSATSGSSHAPSSYQRKRAKITGSTFSSTGTTGPGMDSVGETPSRPASRNDGSLSRAYRSQSRTSQNQSSKDVRHNQYSSSSSQPGPHRAPSRRSLSQASIPISALISPHAPSVSHRSNRFHMRDPRRPAPVRSTPWALSLPTPGDGQSSFMAGWTWRSVFSRLRGRGPDEKVHDRVGWIEGGGSPLHAWLFFIGFLLFPLWWIASVLGIPETRRIGADGVEKAVVLDDPQVEFDSRSWRKRCRIMAAVSFLTYVPFIILIAVFAPR